MKKINSIRDILEFEKETAIPLGLLLYRASKNIITITRRNQNDDTVTLNRDISPLVINHTLFESSICFSLVFAKDDDERNKFVSSSFSQNGVSKLYDMASDFLTQFPTPELAKEKLPRPVVFSDNSVTDHALDTLKHIRDLTIDEAHDLILAKPLVRNFKDNFSAAKVDTGQMIESPKATLPEIEDPTDQRIWEWIKEDPSITDADIAQRLGISRQAVNPRRRSLEKMGYPVRKVSRQK